MTEYEICVILEGGYMLNAEPKYDMPSAQKWAAVFSTQPGVKRVIITQTETRVLYGYKDGAIEPPSRYRA